MATPAEAHPELNQNAESDFKDEHALLTHNIDLLEREIKKTNNKLNNPGFITKAPAAAVEKQKDKLAEYERLLGLCQKRLANL